MGDLKDLFDKLNDSVYCRYNEEGIYPVEGVESVVKLRPKELLEVGRTYPSREHIMIAYFGEDPTRVLYFGENATSMKETLDDLRLPGYSSNLGENVFRWFKSHLRVINDLGPFGREEQVVSGKEHQFDLVLRKFVDSYQSQDRKRSDNVLKELLDMYLAYQEQQSLREKISTCSDEAQKNVLGGLLRSFQKQDEERLRPVMEKMVLEIYPRFSNPEISERFQGVFELYLENYHGPEKNALLEVARIPNELRIDFILEKLEKYAGNNNEKIDYRKILSLVEDINETT